MPYFFDWQHLPLHARLVSAFRMGIPAGCLPSTLTRQCLAACRTLLVCLGLMLCSSYALAQPTVSSVSPSSGPTSGGTSATISGNNLSSATAVKFGGVTAAITANTATSITATVPAGTGTVDITVTTSGGTATLTNSYTYVAAPTVTNISPSSGPTGGGTSVTITGTNFNGTTAVKFGATSATGATINSNTQITATAPAGSGTVDITVTTTGGTSITSAADQYTYVAAPTLTSVSPNSGNTAGGTSVTLTGTNFTGATSVSFGGIAATGVTVVNATTITATTPAHSAGAVNVAVTTPSGTTAPNSSYTFIAPNPPVADAVSVTVAANSSNNPITLNLSGGVATSVAVASGPSQGTTNVSGTTITYTPAAGYSGNDSFTYTATGPGGTSALATVTLTISPPTLVISPNSLSNATASNAYSQTLSTANGATPYRYAVSSGAVPPGLSLGSGGVLSGTPSVVGTFNFTVTSTDAHNATGSKAYSLTVGAATIAITPTTLGPLNAGTAYGQTLSATGGNGSYTWSTAGSLPPGITVNSSSGLVSGTPTSGGNYSFTVTATDSLGSTGSRGYGVTVNDQAPVASNSTLTVQGGSNNNLVALNFTGGSVSQLSIVSNASNGTATATGTTILFTPSPGFSGPDSFTYNATGPGGTSNTATVSVTVTAPTISITPATLTNATQNTAYSQALTASGSSGSYAFSVVAGSLPAGMNLSSVGLLSGTPSAVGSSNFTVRAMSSSGFFGDHAYTLTVTSQAPVAGPVSLSVAANSSANPVTLNLSGGTTASVSVSSAATHGTTSVSGTSITYTPTAGYSGNDSFTYTATGPGGSSSAATVSITVSAPTLAITPATPSLPAATLNTAYPPVALSASSGTAPYSYAVTAGSLPAGLSLNTTTGTISGTPTAIATYNFTITATDAHGATGSRAYSLDIQAQAVVVPPSNETVVAGQTASVDLTRGATGGPFTSATLLSVAPQQAGIVQIVAPSTLSFTPAVSYSGSAVVNFRLLATSGAQGNGFLTFTVTAAAPTASPIAVNTAANQPVTINAIANAAGAPFIGGPSISSQPASGSVVVQGMNLVYTPAASTQGSISFTYTLANAGGVSAPIAVMVQVAARPDPTVNADVRGLSTAQQQASVRFAGAQLLNFTQRLEQLRNPQQRQAFQNGLQLAMPRAGNNSIRNCQNVPSMLGQQDCIARQGMDSGSALAPRWGRTAQPDALAAVEGLNAEQAYASRLDSETANAPATLGSAQRNLAQRAVALGAGTTTRNTRVNADEPLPEPGSAERPRLAYWTAGMLDWGFADASKGQDDGLRFTTSGVTMGLDYLVNAQWTVGMGMGFAYDRTTIGSEGSRNHSKGVSTALYGSWSPAPAYFVDGVLGYSRLRFDSRRWVADAGEFAQGERDGSQWFASVSAGYEWRTQQMLLSPYGRLQWARSNLDAYTETGAGWHALQFGEQRITSTSASLGLRGETSHDTRWGQLMPFGRLELQHDFDHQSDVRIAYADLNGSQGYAISSNPIGRNRVQVGFGSRLQSRMGTFAAELQFTRSNTSFQRGMRLLYTTRY